MTSRALVGVLLVALAAGPGRASADAAGRRSTFPATITFDSSSEKSETRIGIADLAPGFPRDWSGYEALVLELRASSPQRIHLRVYTGDGAPGKERFSHVLFHPYPRV